jgi:small subunit ribosomal protein S21
MPKARKPLPKPLIVLSNGILKAGRSAFGKWLFRPWIKPERNVDETSFPLRRGFYVQVLVRDNNVDQALRVLKKKLQREGVFREMKLRRNYEKPSEKRAREKAEAVRRARKVERKRKNAKASRAFGIQDSAFGDSPFSALNEAQNSEHTHHP